MNLICQAKKIEKVLNSGHPGENRALDEISNRLIKRVMDLYRYFLKEEVR